MTNQKKCPRCGCETFIVDAHIIQEWIVDAIGSFVDVNKDCTQVTHFPDDDDIWQCEQCGYEDTGGKFNIEE